VTAVEHRTPVLVGAAACTNRTGDYEPFALMAEAARAAEADAGTPGLLARAGVVFVPKGTWPYHDAAGLLAGALGCTDARRVVTDLGVLQTTPFLRAADAIARGDVDVVLIAGGEARARWVRGNDTVTDDTGAEPDEFVRPAGMIVSQEEIDARLITAVSQYALIENARRYADGQTLTEHAAAIARHHDEFAAVAATNPDAWEREAFALGRPIAFPYHKGHVSQMNIDQGAAFILCAAETADAFGVARDRWVFPHAIVESNAMIPVTHRAEIHRSPGFSAVGARAWELAGMGVDDIAHIDLYSCFPIAVRTQRRELGVGDGRVATVTGGMALAGGPLNNYVFQALAKMVTILRDEAGAAGLVTAISGMITKQGASIWSTAPPAAGYRSDDVSDAALAATATKPGVRHATGAATVATSTVLYDRSGAAEKGVVITDVDGGRAIAVTTDTETMASMTSEEWCGRTIQLTGDGSFRV